MLVVYYSVLIAWVINAFFDAFGDEAPWADEGVVMSPLPTFWKNYRNKHFGESQKATHDVG
jgi:hypothetical protein